MGDAGVIKTEQAKKTSIFWKQFQLMPTYTNEKKEKVKCRRCGVVDTYDSKNGNCIMLQHIRRCPQGDVAGV